MAAGLNKVCVAQRNRTDFTTSLFFEAFLKHFRQLAGVFIAQAAIDLIVIKAVHPELVEGLWRA
jgi:hypothetical protein